MHLQNICANEFHDRLIDRHTPRRCYLSTSHTEVDRPIDVAHFVMLVVDLDRPALLDSTRIKCH